MYFFFRYAKVSLLVFMKKVLLSEITLMDNLYIIIIKYYIINIYYTVFDNDFVYWQE